MQVLAAFLWLIASPCILNKFIDPRLLRSLSILEFLLCLAELFLPITTNLTFNRFLTFSFLTLTPIDSQVSSISNESNNESREAVLNLELLAVFQKRRPVAGWSTIKQKQPAWHQFGAIAFP